MKLKRLELCGFKSFKDKTVIHFGEGSTGIVGPNGCGKSNVVDAFFWVMGEMSPKHLRGSSMDDVIFAGSNQFSPASFAEVNLAFEKREPGKLPGEYVDREIVVTRKLARDGSSSYFVNYEPARLKDIQELLMDFGIGNRSYSIIEQGAISRMITAKAEERRGMIEEAAGITKFKMRKKETVRKLEQTENNLRRLSDIISELEERKKTLERQADKARKARELRDQLRTLDFEVYHHRYWKAKQQEILSSQELTRLQDQLATLMKELAAAQARSADLGQELLAQEAALESARTATVQIANQKNSLAAQVSIAAERERSLNRRRQELQADSEERQRQLASLEEDCERLEQELYELQQSDDDRVAIIEEKRAAVDSQRGVVQAAEKKVQELRASVRSQEESRVQHERALQQTAFRRAELEAQVQTYQRDLDSRQLELATASADLEQQQGTHEVALEDVSRLQDEREQLEENKRSADVRWEQLKNQEKDLQRQLLEAEAREKSLRAMIENREFSDFGELLKQHPQLKLLEEDMPIDAQWDVAARAALAGFGLLLNQKPSSDLGVRTSWVVSEGGEQLSVENCLSQYLQSSAPEALKAFLGRVKVVETIDESLWDTVQVTQEGDFFARGVRTVGPFKAVSCRSLKEEQDQLLLVMSRLSDQLNELPLVQAETEVLGLDSQIQVRREMLADAQAKAKASEGGIRKAQAQVSQLEQVVARLQSQLNQHQESLAKILSEASTQEVQTGGVALNETREALAEAELVLVAARQSYDDLQSAFQDARLGEAAREERIRNSQAEKDRAQRTISQFLAKIESNQSQSAEAAEELESLLTGLEDQQQELVQLGAQELVLLEEYNKLRETVMALRQQGEELRVAMTDLSTQERSLHSSIHQHDKMLEVARSAVAQSEEYMYQRYEFNVQDFGEPEDVWTEDFIQEKFQESARMREKLTRLGDVNYAAVDEYDTVAARYQFLEQERLDLHQSIEQLNDAIVRIEQTTSERFAKTFELVNEKFQRVFPVIFGGGAARLQLVDPTTPDGEVGLDIIAQPPGKKMTNINLMSGGEKAMTAISLIFAMFLIKPSPFCLLDEVDAPLDDTNIGRFNELIRELSTKSQFVVITHNKRTMEYQDKLYGVTMQQPGVSRMVAVQLQ